MKNKYIIALFVFGFIFTIFGALCKITHWEMGSVNGSLLLTIGFVIQIIVATIFIAKLFSNKNNSFLNK